MLCDSKPLLSRNQRRNVSSLTWRPNITAELFPRFPEKVSFVIIFRIRYRIGFTLLLYFHKSRRINAYTPRKDKFHEAVVNLTEQKVERNVRLGPNEHGPGDFDEILSMERIALEHEDIKAEIAKLKLPEGAVVVADPWIYGTGIREVPLEFRCLFCG